MALSTLTYGLFRAPISPPTGAPHASAGKVWSSMVRWSIPRAWPMHPCQSDDRPAPGRHEPQALTLRWQAHVPGWIQTHRAVVKRDMTQFDIAVMQQDHAQD